MKKLLSQISSFGSVTPFVEKEGSLPSCQDPVTGPCNGAWRMHSFLLYTVSRILILAFLPSGPVSCKWFFVPQRSASDQWQSVRLSWLFYNILTWVRSPAATVLLSLSPCPERPRRSHGLVFKRISLSVNAALAAWSRWFCSTLC
jgi:hypothetical protein